MDRACKQFLARSCFTHYQDSGIGWRSLCRQFYDASECRAAADDGIKAARRANFTAQQLILPLQLILEVRVFH